MVTVMGCVQFKEDHKSMLHKSDEEKKTNTNLLDCVKLFTMEEQLGEDNPWYASCCIHTHICRCIHTHICRCMHTQTQRLMHAHTQTHNVHCILRIHCIRYCPSCKGHKQAFKKFNLWKLMEILVIHLKRFTNNRYWRHKLDVLVDFPVQQVINLIMLY